MKEFLNEPFSFKSDRHPVTPFMRAQQEWDNRIGSSVVQAKNWRFACLVSLIATVALTAGLLYQSSKTQVIPVIVGIDKERGEPVVMGPVDKNSYHPQIQEVKYFITHFISLVRSVPQDPVLIKQNWLNAYAFLRHDAANVLNDITNKDPESPLKKIGQQTVIVQPLSVVQVDNSESFQARWQETIYNAHGNPTEHYVMNAVFTLDIEAPKDPKTLIQNPLGLYIKSFQWSKEL